MVIREALRLKGIYCSEIRFQYALAVATVDIKANNIYFGKRTNFNTMVDLVEKSIKILEKINLEGEHEETTTDLHYGYTV